MTMASASFSLSPDLVPAPGAPATTYEPVGTYDNFYSVLSSNVSALRRELKKSIEGGYVSKDRDAVMVSVSAPDGTIVATRLTPKDAAAEQRKKLAFPVIALSNKEVRETQLGTWLWNAKYGRMNASQIVAKIGADLLSAIPHIPKVDTMHNTATATTEFPWILPPSDEEAGNFLDENLVNWHSGMDDVYALSSNWCTRNKRQVPREIAEGAISILSRYSVDPRYAEDKAELEQMIGYIREAIDEADSFARGDTESGFYSNFWNKDGSVKDEEAYASLEATASMRISSDDVLTAWANQNKVPRQVVDRVQKLISTATNSLYQGGPGWFKATSALKQIFEKYPLSDMVYHNEEDSLEPMSWVALEDWAKRQATEYAEAEVDKDSDEFDDIRSREYDSIISQYSVADSSDLMGILLPESDLRHAVASVEDDTVTAEDINGLWARLSNLATPTDARSIHVGDTYNGVIVTKTGDRLDYSVFNKGIQVVDGFLDTSCSTSLLKTTEDKLTMDITAFSAPKTAEAAAPKVKEEKGKETHPDLPEEVDLDPKVKLAKPAKEIKEPKVKQDKEPKDIKEPKAKQDKVPTEIDVPEVESTLPTTVSDKVKDSKTEPPKAEKPKNVAKLPKGMEAKASEFDQDFTAEQDTDLETNDEVKDFVDMEKNLNNPDDVAEATKDAVVAPEVPAEDIKVDLKTALKMRVVPPQTDEGAEVTIPSDVPALLDALSEASLPEDVVIFITTGEGLKTYVTSKNGTKKTLRAYSSERLVPEHAAGKLDDATVTKTLDKVGADDDRVSALRNIDELFDAFATIVTKDAFTVNNFDDTDDDAFYAIPDDVEKLRTDLTSYAKSASEEDDVADTEDEAPEEKNAFAAALMDVLSYKDNPVAAAAAVASIVGMYGQDAEAAFSAIEDSGAFASDTELPVMETKFYHRNGKKYRALHMSVASSDKETLMYIERTGMYAIASLDELQESEARG